MEAILANKKLIAEIIWRNKRQLSNRKIKQFPRSRLKNLFQ
jgi:hypothetical protein